jgi:hypothetical protein
LSTPDGIRLKPAERHSRERNKKEKVSGKLSFSFLLALVGV